MSSTPDTGGSADSVEAETSEKPVSTAASFFRREGYVILENVLEPSLIESLQTAFNKRYPVSKVRAQPRDSLKVGNRRYMVPLRLRPPFTDARLFGNPMLMGVLTELLGPNRILFGVGAVVSLPGSEDQHVHSDLGRWGLFGDATTEGDLPAFAITIIAPLVDMNEETGTTRVYPGSHRMTKDDLQTAVPEDHVVRAGDVLLMDYRLHHGGLRNRSAAPRPILYLGAGRPWFRDPVNYSKHPALSYSSVDRRRMPGELRALLPPSTGTSIDERAVAAVRKVLAHTPIKRFPR
jgi:ectoine hydroxylase-related dioxygenase (phytanoyl-CoA dioxygenase family)